MKTRHADYERFFQDFIRIRGPLNGPIYYAKFLDAYQLDDSVSYEVTNQARLMEYALKSPKHQAIKRQYPRSDFDRFITGIRRSVGRALKLRTKHPIKLRLKNMRGRRLKLTFGGEG